MRFLTWFTRERDRRFAKMEASLRSVQTLVDQVAQTVDQQRRAPSVAVLGDHVFYVARDRQVLAAIVTDVGGAGIHTLCVFRKNGSTYGVSHVPFDGDGSPHSWHVG